MNLTVRQMQAFVQVVHTRSFTAAAQRMHLTQSALSLLVRRLEEELGVRLLDRTTRAVVPTDAGLEFHESATRILDDLAHAAANMDKLAARQRGRVVVAAPLVLSATFLATTLGQFRARHPGIELVLKDSLPDQVLPQVRSGAADLGVGTFRRTEEDLVGQVLFAEPLVVALPAGHRLAARHELTWRDLVGEPLISLPRGNVFSELAEAGFLAAGVQVQPAFEANYVGTVVGLVRAGAGVAVVPEYVMALGDAGSLSWRRLVRPAMQREVLMVHRRERSLSPAAQTLADEVIEAGRALARMRARRTHAGKAPAAPA
ncbi:MAG TPA: LysR family transcriptional regulator [Luteimonas sp.]|nr:LysR family transcriptional regulator [Luteimonas sp.]